MNHKIILAFAALISALAALVGVFYKKHEAPMAPQPTTQQSQAGAGNVQVSGQGNTVQVQPVKPNGEPDFCEGFFPDLDDSLYKHGEPFRAAPNKMVPYKEGADFFSCVSRNSGKIIKLSVWLGDKRLKKAEDYLAREGRLYFHVGQFYEFSTNPTYYSSHNGAEYLITLGKDTDTSFTPAPRRLATITGFYKVSNIVGPFQGAMSISLKGVRIEDLPR